MADSAVAITAGSGTNIDTVTTPGGDHRQVVIPARSRGGYEGRVATFRTPGRAATSQKIFAIHNATGSSIAVDVHKISVDVFRTAASATLTDYILVRLWKFTAVPTNGTALTKVAADSGSGQSTSSSVTVWGDASADGTGSGTTLTITLPAGTFIAQSFGSRLLTAVGYEVLDTMDFLAGDSESITLRALEGLAITIDGTTGGNPTTTWYTVACQWEEYTP